jgi:outer membrane lipoprotein SlyB
MRLSIAIVAAALSTGCTTLAPHAEDVRTTSHAEEVAHCTAMGSVRSVPPYIMPNEDLKQLRNKAVALGADTVLITGPRLISTAGIAYKCAK